MGFCLKHSDKILIAGGGIGGLTAAVAIAQHGRPVHVLERTSTFSEAGAGIQLGPNAVRVLERLGIGQHLTAEVGKPEVLEIFDVMSGERITELPLGEFTNARYGAPYWVVHRRDLQRALLSAAETSSTIQIETGFHVEHVEQAPDGVFVSTATRKQSEGAGLVGADGTWSEVRSACFTDLLPQFVRKTAFRGVVDQGQVPKVFSGQNIGLWLGRASHLEHYPVSGGREVSVVVMVDDDWHGRDWGASADGETLARRLKGNGWGTKILQLVSATRKWSKWALHAGPRIKKWTDSRVTLLGDAAHPVLPYLAQGGGMAIEDAAALANAVGSRNDIVPAFAKYERMRFARATYVQAASRRFGWLFHLSPAPALLRNIALRSVSGQRLLYQLDWLYGDGKP